MPQGLEVSLIASRKTCSNLYLIYGRMSAQQAQQNMHLPAPLLKRRHMRIQRRCREPRHTKSYLRDFEGSRCPSCLRSLRESELLWKCQSLATGRTSQYLHPCHRAKSTYLLIRVLPFARQPPSRQSCQRKSYSDRQVAQATTRIVVLERLIETSLQSTLRCWHNAHQAGRRTNGPRSNVRILETKVSADLSGLGQSHRRRRWRPWRKVARTSRWRRMLGPKES